MSCHEDICCRIDTSLVKANNEIGDVMNDNLNWTFLDMYRTARVILGVDHLRPEAHPASPSWARWFWWKWSAIYFRKAYSMPPNWCWPEAAPAASESCWMSTVSPISCGCKEPRRKCAGWPILAGSWIMFHTLLPTVRIHSDAHQPRPFN